VVVVAAVLALAGLSWLTWAALSASDSDVEAELVAWDVVSPHAVEAELVVHREHGDEVTCTVSAQAADGIVVGEAETRLPAGQKGEYRVEVTVRTEREASAVRLAGCS
jgi:guanyl-specific ribonuclease Sa